MSDFSVDIHAPTPIRRTGLSRRGIAAVGGGALLAVALLIAVLAALAPLLPLQDPLAQNLRVAFQQSSSAHWLGTDELGRDLFSRLVWGTRTSVFSSILATAIAGVVGVPAGLLAAYIRGPLDILLGRLADTSLTLPGLVLLLAVQAALQTGVYVSMAIFGLLMAPQLFRVVRSATLSTARQAFVKSGRLSGSSHARILYRYLFPNVSEQIAVQLSFLLGFALLVETGISFLGVGVQAPYSSLGTLIAEGTTVMAFDFATVLFPGVVLTTLILACNVAGDALAKTESYG